MNAATERNNGIQKLPDTRWSLLIGGAFSTLARIVSWVWVLLIAVIVVNVVMRYALGDGRIEFEEIQWHLYAVGFLIGLSTCFSTDQHVRVDAFSAHLSLNARSWVELYGLVLLFFPFVAMVLAFSVPFVGYSFSIGEVSGDPGGLGARWLIKSVLPISMLLLLVAGIARLLRVTAFLFGTPDPVPNDGTTDVNK